MTKSKTDNPDNKIHEANVGHVWGRQEPDGPHVGHKKLAIWELYSWCDYLIDTATIRVRVRGLAEYKTAIQIKLSCRSHNIDLPHANFGS